MQHRSKAVCEHGVRWYGPCLLCDALEWEHAGPLTLIAWDIDKTYIIRTDLADRLHLSVTPSEE